MKLDPMFFMGISIALGYGMTLWLIKKWFTKLDKRLDDLDDRLDKQEKRYWLCRETALKEFANRDDTKNHIAGLFKRVEDLAIGAARCEIKKGM